MLPRPRDRALPPTKTPAPSRDTYFLTALFGIDKSGISGHLKNISESRELKRRATVSKIAAVR